MLKSVVSLLSFILFSLLIFCSSAWARISKIEDFWQQDSTRIVQRSLNLSCANLGAGWSDTAGVECDTMFYGNRTCYNCSNSCSQHPEWVLSCSGQFIGGEYCIDDNGERKYKTCSCPADYNKLCHHPQSGSGEFCQIGEVKTYKSCACPANWSICETGSSNLNGVASCTSSSGITYYNTTSFNTCSHNGAVDAKKCALTNGSILWSDCSDCSNYHLCTGNGQSGSGNVCHKYNSAAIDKFDPVYQNCVCDSSYKQCTAQETPASNATTCNQIINGVQTTLYSSCTNNHCHMEYGALHNGKAYTQAIVDQIGEKGLAAYAATQFYAPGTDPHDPRIGQGQWYLPAIGEWLDLWGYDEEAWIAHDAQIANYWGNEYATGENITTINNTLATLAGSGVRASMINQVYHSSSEGSASYYFSAEGASVGLFGKISSAAMRVSLSLENYFTPSSSDTRAPQVGDVMYSDLSYGSASNSSKTAIGVVYWTSDDGTSAKVINLKDLTFSSIYGIGNFDPANPYDNNTSNITYCINDLYEVDITAIPNYYLSLNGEYYRNPDFYELNSGTWVCE